MQVFWHLHADMRQRYGQVILKYAQHWQEKGISQSQVRCGSCRARCQSVRHTLSWGPSRGAPHASMLKAQHCQKKRARFLRLKAVRPHLPCSQDPKVQKTLLMLFELLNLLSSAREVRMLQSWASCCKRRGCCSCVLCMTGNACTSARGLRNVGRQYTEHQDAPPDHLWMRQLLSLLPPLPQRSPIQSPTPFPTEHCAVKEVV